MKKILNLLIFICLLSSIFTPAVSFASEGNVPLTVFIYKAYTLGRLYGIKKEEGILNEYSGLFSSKDTFCLVLMYHNIYTKKKQSVYDVSMDDFKRHVSILKKYGFESITLTDLYGFLKFNKKIPERSVIFTFDDGFKSVVPASKVLRENGWTGVSSIITGYVGSSWEISLDDIRALENMGFEFASHSHKLHNLYGKLLKEKKYDILKRDIVASIEYFKDNLKESPFAFTYPQGAYDKKIEHILSSQDIKIGFGLFRKRVNKFGDNPLYVSRIEISERTRYANPTKFEAFIKSVVEENSNKP